MTNNTSRMEDLFEFQVLTKILGPLNYRVLKRLKDQIKSNAACIDSDLGGGANGHLGLILTDVEYALVCPLTPYVRHVMPNDPIIDGKTKAHEAIRLRDEFKEAKSLYKEMISLEKALLKKISAAVPAMYLKQFRNKHSNALDKPIPEIMEHLFSVYGRVPQEELDEAESKLRAQIFDISEPLVLMFNEIDEMQDMATAAENEFSDQQIVNLGIHLIKNTGDFEKGITEWYESTTTKNWKSFKSHF